MSVMPGRLKRMVFAAIVLIAPLLLAELGARAIEWVTAPADQVDLSIPPKPPGTFRIFVYGGSTVVGKPLPELGFVAQLDHALGTLGLARSADVHNCGTSGRHSTIVRARVEETVEADPDLLIVLTGHNEFLPINDRPLEAWVVHHSALTRLLQRLLRQLRAWRSSAGYPARVPATTWVAFDRASSRYQDKVVRFRRNLEGIIATAREHAVPVLLITAPYNLRDWRPIYKNVRGGPFNAGYEAAMDRLLELSRRDPTAARSELTRLQATYPGDAVLSFVEGQLALQRNEWGRAHTALQAAKEAEAIPVRALDAINQITRDLAAEHGLPLVDMEKEFKAAAPNGLVDFELVADNVHTTPLGSAMLVRSILKAMDEQGWLVPHPELGSPMEILESFRSSFSPAHWRELETDWALNNVSYLLRPAISDLHAARRYLDQASALAPGCWRVAAFRASIELLEGQAEAARASLLEAESLLGRPLSLAEVVEVPRLHEVMLEAGLPLPGGEEQ